jgi:hypothetical protein
MMDNNNNSGNLNSGDYNSGDYNSGFFNSGDYNSGNRNSGDLNSGDYNSGDYNSGFFNTNEPSVRLFNKDTDLKRSEIDIPCIHLPINEWVCEDNMTHEQKKDDPDFHSKQGTLITRTYKEAWANAWDKLNSDDKQRFLDLPNFCPDIFEEITGVRVGKKESCNGKVVEIEGKKYKLQEM